MSPVSSIEVVKQRVVAFFANAPALNPYTLVSLLGFSISVFNLWRSFRPSKHKLALQVAEERQRTVQEDLVRGIERRLEERDVRLLRAGSVRQLAFGLQKRIGAPDVPDSIIAEAVRSVALSVEDRCRGKQLTLRMEKLNALLEELQPGSGSLLSFAITDPISAYRQSIGDIETLTRATGFLALLASIAFVLSKNPFWGTTIAIVLPLNILLLISGTRAFNYWSNAGKDRSRSDLSPASLLNPSKLNAFMDFFVSITSNQSPLHRRLWDTCWAPFMEREHILAKYAVDIHQYRYFEARGLIEELLTLSKRVSRSGALDADLQERYIGLCRQLWVLTGIQKYRALEEQARKGYMESVNVADLHPFLGTANPNMKSPVLLAKYNIARAKISQAGLQEFTQQELQEYVATCDRLYEITHDELYRQSKLEALEVVRHS